MSGIFISYRRQDASGHAGRLRDHLRNRFGRLVFQDVDDIPDGEIFEQVLGRALASCQVALVVIGRDWLTCTDETGRRRLDDPQDWVRIETGQVLSRDIRVIPVLVRGATMPRAEELPEELRGLAKRQAREVRDTSWDADVRALIQRLEEVLKLPPNAPLGENGARRDRKGLIALAGGGALVVALALGWVLMRGDGASMGPRETEPARKPEAAMPAPAVNPTVAAAKMFGLPGTRWRMEDFSGMEPEAGRPDAYEVKVDGETVVLDGVGADPAKHRMIVKQIQDRAITFLPQPSGGKPSEVMYVFELAPDGSRLDNCQTVRAANFEALGPCRWRYRRAAAGGARSVQDKFATTVSCGHGMPSGIDPACVAAAKAAGLVGAWRAGEKGDIYRFTIDGDAVRLSSPALRGGNDSRLSVRSVKDGVVSLAWAGFLNKPSEIDPQTWYEYELTADGSRLVNCTEATLLSTRTDRSQCSDVPPFLVRDRSK